MKRRDFILGMGLLGASAAAWGGYQYWPKPGLMNPCLPGLPDEVRNHPLMQKVWQGLDSAQVWDCHVHLVGTGDSATSDSPWFNPNMDSYWHPILKLQKAFYMNGACADPDHIDQSTVARMVDLVAEMPAGFKTMLFAFDWFHDEAGKPQKPHSIFNIPNNYAARIAHAHPQYFEWVCSIHPYRADCVDALEEAKSKGARAIKWLPNGMGIDPLSEKCDRFYEAAAKLAIPIISHTGRESAVQGGNQDDGNPLRLRRALDHGVKVVLAHCASDGDDIDLDQGKNGERVKSFELFARMMDEPKYAELLRGEISALTLFNHAWAIKPILQRPDWHARLLNGSDYPLPGIMPLYSPPALAKQGLLEETAVPFLENLRGYNPLLFDLALKRLLRFEEQSFPASVFETRRFFNPD
ncbi:amidohydrolase family protein [Methyloradius palustris]|uniref:Amidohydrolase-related domain-containing protein n=1 Tax=Methyloradius palustris TaxID=2778876 RepID=A0A8D5JMW8_9PROT|nr:amidohydrolase family protein [Methyloradius palustris]BCM26275.1 hypothetical protein ZMTM_25340 [Methyloradius palustris]